MRAVGVTVHSGAGRGEWPGVGEGFSEEVEEAEPTGWVGVST